MMYGWWFKRFRTCLKSTCPSLWMCSRPYGQRRRRVFLGDSPAVWRTVERRDFVAGTTRYIDGLGGLRWLREQGEAGCSNQGFLCPVDWRRNRPADILGVSFPPQLYRPSRGRGRRGPRGRKARGSPRFEDRRSRATWCLELLRRWGWRRGLYQGIWGHKCGAVASGHTQASFRRRLRRFDRERRRMHRPRTYGRWEGASGRCRKSDVGDGRADG